MASSPGVGTAASSRCAARSRRARRRATGHRSPAARQSHRPSPRIHRRARVPTPQRALRIEVRGLAALQFDRLVAGVMQRHPAVAHRHDQCAGFGLDQKRVPRCSMRPRSVSTTSRAPGAASSVCTYSRPCRSSRLSDPPNSRRVSCARRNSPPSGRRSRTPTSRVCTLSPAYSSPPRREAKGCQMVCADLDGLPRGRRGHDLVWVDVPGDAANH